MLEVSAGFDIFVCTCLGSHHENLNLYYFKNNAAQHVVAAYSTPLISLQQLLEIYSLMDNGESSLIEVSTKKNLKNLNETLEHNPT